MTTRHPDFPVALPGAREDNVRMWAHPHDVEHAASLPDLAPQLQAACDEGFNVQELEKIGERIWNMEREFNNAAGLTKADDSLPRRLLTEAAKTGGSQGAVSHLPEMLPKYYAVRGWDAEGRPTPETRARLGL